MKKSLLYKIYGRKSTLEKVIFTIVFILFGLYSIALFYPLVWGGLSSLKTTSEYFDNVYGLPKKWQFVNYSKAVKQITDGGMSFANMMWNSTWFSVGSAFIHIEVVSIYSYVLNKYTFKGRKFLYGMQIFMISVPIGATFITTYKIYYALHMANSYLILLSAVTISGSQVIMFYAFYGNISRSYSEAAQMDGAGHYQTYFKAIRPQVQPMILSLFLLEFISKWNDYMSPLLFMSKMPTLSTGLYRYQSVVERTGNYPVLFAGLFICIIPLFVIFGLFNDKIMSNINIGGLKG